METNTQGNPATNGVYGDIAPSVSEQNDQVQEEPQNQGSQRKKYHSSAMYAANAWHSTMKHVKQHQNHTGLNL